MRTQYDKGINESNQESSENPIIQLFSEKTSF